MAQATFLNITFPPWLEQHEASVLFDVVWIGNGSFPESSIRSNIELNGQVLVGNLLLYSTDRTDKGLLVQRFYSR